MILAASMVALLTVVPGHTDTTLTVPKGTRLEVSNFTGGVSVDTWDRDAVRIQADHHTRTHVGIERRDDRLQISSEGERGTPGSVEYHITTPSWMALDIEGPFSDVDVEGSRGDVKVETVKGDVSVQGGSGTLELSSVEGDVSVLGARGRMKLSSINQAVTVSKVAGQIEAETVNGDVVLDNVDLDACDASSVGGNVWFNGALKEKGHYQLQSHSGNVEVVAADRPNAAVTVSTFSGDFNSDFDVMLSGTHKREFTFTLGTGAAQLQLESFSGNIRLLKASEVEALRARLKSRGMLAPRAKEKEKDKDKEKYKDKDKDKDKEKN